MMRRKDPSPLNSLKLESHFKERIQRTAVPTTFCTIDSYTDSSTWRMLNTRIYGGNQILPVWDILSPADQQHSNRSCDVLACRTRSCASPLETRFNTSLEEHANNAQYEEE